MHLSLVLQSCKLLCIVGSQTAQVLLAPDVSSCRQQVISAPARAGVHYFERGKAAGAVSDV